jgi:CRP-like cAMP-binding protein
VIELVRDLSDGRDEVFAIAETGEYFGELSPMFQLPRAATARARTDTLLTSCSLRDFRDQVPRLQRAAESSSRPDSPAAGPLTGVR